MDPHTFDADPDPAFYLDADPDPGSLRNKLEFFVQNKNNEILIFLHLKLMKKLVRKRFVGRNLCGRFSLI